MAQATGTTTIENPVINTPFAEPARHFVMADGQPTGEIDDRRRPSEFFVPVARPRKASGAQLTIDYGGLTRQQPNEIVNEIRQSVARWRAQGYPHTTSVTRDLLAHWQSEDRERRLFFCQIEAAEMAIYLTEAAERIGDTKALNVIRQENATLNGGLPRFAFKMATGSGKTVVMAMLIAWQALNKQANPQDRRFSDKFLIVTPGITIRDRLRVLLPNDPQSYYRQLEILSAEQIERLHSATIVITNFHAFLRREKIQAASLTKKVLAGGADDDRFKETPAEMVRRVCREFGSSKGIVVLNDEAHHCYAPAPKEQAEEGTLDADERSLAKKDLEEARVWLSGLQAVQEKLGIRAVYDLSATPFFLKGSGYAEGTLFPWVVSDFGLMDAIESGIVKIPRVPVSDDSMTGEGPMYRDLWLRVRDALPRKGIKDTPIDGEPIIPKELEGALRSLYDDYERSHAAWAEAGMGTPPVFIVVCSNTATSKLVADWISGWERELPDGSKVNVPGHLPLFTNVRDDGLLLDRPNTLLVDSAQLDRGDALDPAFRKAAHAEIERFKHEYVTRFPGRSAEDITDEDILREVMNTVGKQGRLGEHIRCVVSVAMLTEGWDANTVTHILGIRAFGTQLLCEQVVGRALRRASYDADENGMFEPEYAEVYGVPFSFLSVSGKGRVKKPRHIREVRALPDRAHLRIEFPRVIGYRFEMPTETLEAHFDETSVLQLSPKDVATETQLDPIIGEREIHQLNLRDQRMQTVAFTVAKRTLDNHFRDEDEAPRPWLFPQLLRITQDWIEQYVEPYMHDHAYPQLLLLAEYSHAAAEKIQRGIYAGTRGEKRLMPTLRAYEPIGSTDDVRYETTKTCYETERSHVNLVPQDSGWESKLAEVLESMPEVVSYVKNQGLNFKIPYTYEGRAGNYVPDFLIRLRDAESTADDDLLTLVLEVSGEAKKEKQAKVAYAEHQWTEAVNNWGQLGRWAFIEITDPWDAESLIRERYLSGKQMAARPA
ncbi:MAG TPA: DEAD/DEAH box helicase family protein [Candidatus Limnocylindrales bacterium]|nr:DEAD/DEAH box helicase family protein [Candidatus Limnocylindrales bacterium]